MRIQLGNSFAEYDPLLKKAGVFVTTPQIQLAADGSGCFFVGRRGTGKTAATLHLVRRLRHACQILPQAFEFQGLKIDTVACKDTRQRPFKSLLLSFQKTIIYETLREWLKHRIIKPGDLPPQISRDRNLIEEYEFDSRALALLNEFQEAQIQGRDKEWLKLVRRATNDIPEAFNDVSPANAQTALIFDRIDEAWDGSDQAVLLLMALAHACIEVTTQCPAIKPKLFLRENIFERVRETDNEFARLETFVVPMDWTHELLLELVERRLNDPFNTKLPLRGPTWDYFFESPVGGASSQSMVFEYCQERPRDVLTYCKFAIESAQSHKRERVAIEDLQSARKRFSDSRLKDLGDEYAENYPQIQLILARFFGLGTEFTLFGVDSFIKKLLVDEEVKRNCGVWLFSHTTTERFAHLLYNIGFFGIKDGAGTHFRTMGPKSSTPPSLSASTHVVVHPSYHAALSLRDVVIKSLTESTQLAEGGLLQDLPDSISLAEYQDKLRTATENLKTLPTGDAHSAAFEDQVGEIIKLCFFKSLSNVEPKSRDFKGRVIRDWIAANRANFGFWEMIRQKYGSTQIIFECKNYTDLTADDFHQLLYYQSPEIGNFAVCVFRGEVKPGYYEHLSRISRQKNGQGLVLLITERDLHTFIRQAISGKAKEDHIQNLYDNIVRKIS